MSCLMTFSPCPLPCPYGHNTMEYLYLNLFLGSWVGTLLAHTGARHFVERHFVYCDTSSKVFVELPVRRKATSSNAFSSNTTLSRISPLVKIPFIRHVLFYSSLYLYSVRLKGRFLEFGIALYSNYRHAAQHFGVMFTHVPCLDLQERS